MTKITKMIKAFPAPARPVAKPIAKAIAKPMAKATLKAMPKAMPKAVKKDDGSVRDAYGRPTGKFSSGAGWGGEAPIAKGTHQSKK